MSQNHRQTNDPAQLRKVIEQVFVSAPVRLRDRTGETEAKILRYQQPILEIQSPAVDGEARVRLLSLEHGEHLLLLECGVLKRNGASEYLKPVRLHIRPKQRSETRTKIDHGASREPYITGCIPVASIPAQLASLDARRDAIIRVYSMALREKYPEGAEVKVLLRRSNRLDHRMRPMLALQKPIYAPDRFEESQWLREGMEDFIPFGEYRKIRTYQDIPRTYVSEVSEPLWFRSQYLYGYLQVISKEMMDREMYDGINNLARKLELDLEGYECLPRNKTRCEVEDLSPSGVGFLVPRNSPHVKSFMPGEAIFFSLRLPEQEPMELGGVIQNVRNQENGFRFGVEITRIRVEDSRGLDAYLSAD
ncbi:MAG: PilZ domain-containing protein [Leptospirales bacterium]|jgi:hypothetical protein